MTQTPISCLFLVNTQDSCGKFREIWKTRNYTKRLNYEYRPNQIILLEVCKLYGENNRSLLQKHLTLTSFPIRRLVCRDLSNFSLVIAFGKCQQVTQLF